MKRLTCSAEPAVFQEREPAQEVSVCVCVCLSSRQALSAAHHAGAFSIVWNPSTYSRDAMSDQHHGSSER